MSISHPIGSQVGRVCVENCQQFDGFRVTYRLEVPDKNASVEVQSCYTAIGITQAPDEMWGLLYVNDREALRRPECEDLQYIVVAQEEHTQLEASTQIHIILDAEGENSPLKKSLGLKKIGFNSSNPNVICAHL